ncbi:MAG: right-handed parallel beta-helix repeat-containing protein [Candidatus Sulfotelmatobacter sp.]
MQPTLLTRILIVRCAIVFAAICQTAVAGTLCVNPAGYHDCFTSIQTAVNHAAANDLIQVEAGTYKEEVVIGIPIAIVGAGAQASIIDATGLAHGIFVDGFDHPGLKQVTITGLTVENANFEGILIVSASDITIQDNKVIDNDATPGLSFTGAPTGCPDQPGNGVYEDDETGDCGGAIHLVGTANSIVSGNLVTGNADGVLISDETAESHGNLLIHNTVKNNPLECGIVLASHPPSGKTSPPFAPHFGVDHNTVAENLSADNGVKIGGSGVGLFSDGMGRGRVSDNVVIGNTLTHNGLGGVALHTHVGPAFGAPADDMSGNKIIGNTIAANLADTFDTATPGRVGININSGDGASPVRGSVISQNVISDEDIDIAVNTPAEVDIHLNSLLGGGIGVGDVCALDGSSVCTGSVDATENYWGCPGGPGEHGCTTILAARILWIPWLQKPVGSH